MHQTKYRGIITEAGSLTTPPWEPAFRLVKPPIKSVSPFGGDLCFGWLGSLRLYLYKPLVQHCLNNSEKQCLIFVTGQGGGRRQCGGIVD